jgi:hypothetical protein
MIEGQVKQNFSALFALKSPVLPGADLLPGVFQILILMAKSQSH